MSDFNHIVFVKLPGSVFDDSTQVMLDEHTAWLEGMGVGDEDYDSFFCREPNQTVVMAVSTLAYVAYCFVRGQDATLFKLTFG